MPPANVPALARVAAKWSRRASSASGEYEDGVKNTVKSWAAAAQAGEKNYQTAVAEAASKGRFGKGVQKAGDAKWKKNATEKGPARFSQGVAIAEPDYSGAMAPVLETIARTDLPMRGPVGSESNYGRVSALGKALRQLKTGR